MKRAYWHIAFWAAYFLESVLLIFLVNLSRLQAPTLDNLWLAVLNGLVLLVPKALLTYFILYRTLEALASRERRKRGILYSVLALLFSVLLYRALVVWVVNQLIYHWNGDGDLFYPLGFLVALMDIGFVAGVAIAIKQVRLQLQAGEREKNLLQEKLEAELRFLRHQTNPHFLFNTLNNIYALARKKSDATPEVVLKLSKLLRFMLYESSKPSITIEEEVKVLDDYIELEKIRYNDRLTVNFYREIDDKGAAISPLLLLPFVENAFKHGASESHLDAYIHIDLVVQNGRLDFGIENTKEKTEREAQTEHIGLKNVKRQLELLYPHHHLEIKDSAALFTVALQINLNQHEEDPLPDTGR